MDRLVPVARSNRILCAAVALATAASFPARASAQVAPPAARPRFVVVATSEGLLNELGEPASARTGWVVFHATRDDGREGIYASSGGPPVPVAESGGAVQDGNRIWRFARFGRLPTVNDRLTCAFVATFAEGGRAVLKSSTFGTKYEFVADSGEGFRGFGELAVVNAGGEVAFHAALDPRNHPDRPGFDPRRLGDPRLAEDPDRIPPPTRFTFDGRKEQYHEGIFVDRGVELRVLGSTEAGLLEVADGFAFNDSGLVALRVSRRPKSWSLLLDSSGAPLTVAETGSRFSAIGPPALDARGRVAFLAQDELGAPMVCRSWRGGGLPEVLADARDGFVGFGPNVAIDDAGRVAFVARRAGGREGLFLASKRGDAREVLAVGATVERRALRGIRLGPRAFGRSDRLALLVRQEGGAEAVVLLQLGR